MTKEVTRNITELVGSTPLLHLSRFARPPVGSIFAKLEYMNPGGSVKDRAALGMILDAEERGLLKPGSTIIEPTAGNTGVGLALIGISRGYRVVLCVPEGYSKEKMKVMEALGGEVRYVTKDQGMKGAIELAYELNKSIKNSFIPQQFVNPANPAIHERTTGREILEQMKDRVDAVVIGAGTGGTFTGVARAVKRAFPNTLCVLVEPQGSIFGGGKPGPHKVEGIGQSQFMPETLDLSLVDEVMTITDDESFKTVRTLAMTEGVLCGGSSGSAAAAAKRVAERLGEGKNVVTIFPDGAERYMSQGIF
jgi:cysteine synthase A